MGKIYVYNIKEEDHTSEPNNYYIGRTEKNISPLSNPFDFNGKRSNPKKLTFKTRDEAVDAYEKYFRAAYGKIHALTVMFDEIYSHYKRGENIYLGCFCKPLRCHGDFLAEELQRRLIVDRMKERRGDFSFGKIY